MFSPLRPNAALNSAIISRPDLPSLDALDRITIAYLTLPLVIFLLGWLEIWAALPLIACLAYSLRPLIAPWPTGDRTQPPITSAQLTVAVLVGCGWTIFGGTGHLVFANFDWHIRDAVLHDLVTSTWPVGYGALDGKESILRAPVAYFLPAALVGKLTGLTFAHAAMAGWTAAGAILFLLQVLSLIPSRAGIAVMVTVAAMVVLFSGLDIVGSILNGGPRFIANWHIGSHLEWWAGRYQYSSMTTQLFWVPNHALGAWLTIGLLCRHKLATHLDSMLLIIVVAAALWSPLSAIGIVPFVLWDVISRMARQRSFSLFHPRVWAPALLVGLVIAAYLTLDPSRIPKGWSLGEGGGSPALDLLRQAQFFLLEAGFIGAAILAIRRSSQVVLALVILALLPFAYFGAGNDLVMRASIPSLTLLAIGACLALFGEPLDKSGLGKKAVLGGLLLIGAVTPIEEFARAIVLPAWPINLQATLVAADCGRYPANYVARLGQEPIRYLLRSPHRLALAPIRAQDCDNPADTLMRKNGLLGPR